MAEDAAPLNPLDRTFREFYDEKRELEDLFVAKLRALEEKYEVRVGTIIFDDERDPDEPISDIWVQVDFKS